MKARGLVSVSLIALALTGGIGWAADKQNHPSITFEMTPSNPSCLPGAKANVRVTSFGPVELLDVSVSGLLGDAEFDLFVIQVPRAPFGLSWYQGDIETDHAGEGHGHFIGRFSIETFIVAPGQAPAPTPHPSDANSNPQTAPVHTYHLGLWFNSPELAQKAGCPATMTPFNGDHTAGVQVLNTATFPDQQGPLLQLQP